MWPMVKSCTTSGQKLFSARMRKRLLLTLSVRVFDSSLERGIPSRAAAPEGPNTRPPLASRASSRASSTIAFTEIRLSTA